jgi:hypothetical protein
MQLETLIRLCQDYNALGWAVQEQLADVVNGDLVVDKNPNAMTLALRFLRKAARQEVEGAAELADEIEGVLNRKTA